MNITQFNKNADVIFLDAEKLDIYPNSVSLRKLNGVQYHFGLTFNDNCANSDNMHRYYRANHALLYRIIYLATARYDVQIY